MALLTDLRNTMTDLRSLIDLVEQAQAGTLVEAAKLTLPEFLYHVTPAAKIGSILSGGVTPTSYWAVPHMRDYYVECVEDEGDQVSAAG